MAKYATEMIIHLHLLHTARYANIVNIFNSSPLSLTVPNKENTQKFSIPTQLKR